MKSRLGLGIDRPAGVAATGAARRRPRLTTHDSPPFPRHTSLTFVQPWLVLP